MESLVSIKNATCRLGRSKNLKITNFEIREGEHWCIFGANGSGKSVFADLLASKRVESGSYVKYLQGFDPAKDIHFVSFEEQQELWRSDNRLDMSEYSDDVQDKGTLVIDLVKNSRISAYQDSSLLDKLVHSLSLESYLRKGIRFLSSGQTRRALIARALYAFNSSAAQLLIFDDPLESIDIESQVIIKNTISEFLANFTSIQLCRRPEDFLPSLTHVAVLDNLRLTEQGEVHLVKTSAAYKNVIGKRPSIPLNLPDAVSEKVLLSSEEPIIRLNNVDVSYGKLQVLKNFSWQMMPGDDVVIEGPNGCGKSTLLNLIDGDNHKAYGQDVFLFGQKKGSGETIWELKSKFGKVSNELHNKYLRGWRVLDVVVSGFFDSVGLYDESGTTESAIAKKWLETFGLSSLVSSYYDEISFGQQRMVLLARAMVKSPKILILDEPCVGLDNYHRVLILGVIDLISRQTETRIIYVSHTKNEMPSCINIRLIFTPSADGPSSVRIERL